MKPKLVHKEAMDYSFKAREALEKGLYSKAYENYVKAAELESQVAEFYFERPDLEPTRSVVIRSAAFLNIKAGLIEKAKQFIFFGLLYIKDEQILSQLNSALELAVSFGNITSDIASKEFNYLNMLRQRSVHYVIEPVNPTFGHSVSLSMIRDFSVDYLKSLKAYAGSKLRQIRNVSEDIEDLIKKELDTLFNPLVTSSAYGSFKFAIANDFLQRPGEMHDLIELKANIVESYHKEVFVNPLTDNDIKVLKDNFSEDEINEIFRPLTRIKSNTAPYRVGYYDSNDDFSKKFTNKIINRQRQQLLTVKTITQDDIGELENSITHKRSSYDGKVHKTTILKQQMKSAELNIRVNQIEPTNASPILLNEDIILDLSFNSNIGFTFSYPDLMVESTDVVYQKASKAFHDVFYGKLKILANKEVKDTSEQSDWNLIKKLIGNPDALKD